MTSAGSPHGPAVRVHLDVGAGLFADVTPESAAALGLSPGAAVWASVKATEIGSTGRRSWPRLPTCQTPPKRTCPPD